MDLLAAAASFVALVAIALFAAALRRVRRESGRLQVLERIARAADRSHDLEATLSTICDELVPRVADFCMIDLVSDGEGEARRVAVRVSGQGGEALERWLAERHPTIPAAMLASGADELEPRLAERVSDGYLRALAHDEEDLYRLRTLGVRSAVAAPLRARGRMIGTVTLATAWSRRRYRRGDARFARLLAGRLALALDNAGLFAHLERAQSERAEIAATLQRGLLPPPLPRIPGWSAAAMYRPAGAENRVGGDFYDAFPIADGWMLVLGDVTGRGARAASVTAQARYTLRTAARLSGDPAIALSTLNEALLAGEDPALCAVVAFAIAADPGAPVRLVVAGHLPPLLIDGARVTELPETGPVLGAFADASWGVETRALDAGQQLVAVTDGITEASGAGGRFGEARLRAELGGSHRPQITVERLEAALRSFSEGPLEDDAAALAIAPAEAS